MTTKHTQGPWAVSPDGRDIFSKDGFGYRAKTICRMPIDIDRDNARLISAAPELLEALELCESVLADYADRHHGGPKFDAAYAARAAINKAKGI